jgi:hypothetical protein
MHCVSSLYSGEMAIQKYALELLTSGPETVPSLLACLGIAV